MTNVETQWIGELNISYSDFIKMDIEEFTKLFPLSYSGVAIASPLVIRRSRCFNLASGQDIDNLIIEGLHEVTSVVMRYLKSNNLPLHVLLSFEKKSQLWNWYIECTAYKEHK